jgi:hypothetical protein
MMQSLAPLVAATIIIVMAASWAFESSLATAQGTEVAPTQSQPAKPSPNQKNQVTTNAPAANPPINITITSPQPDPQIAKDERDDRLRNLAVQERIGQFTIYLFFVGLAQALASLLAFWVAIRAANAAKRSADIAAQALYTTQRAFIAADFHTTIIGHPATQQPVRWEIQIKWDNTGLTTARPVKSFISPHYINPADIDTFQFPSITTGLQPHGTPPLAPKGGGTSGSVNVTIEQLNAIRANTSALLICGYIEYEDIFFPQTLLHRTQICSRVLVVSDPASQQVPPFRFTAYPKYNEAT